MGRNLRALEGGLSKFYQKIKKKIKKSWKAFWKTFLKIVVFYGIPLNLISWIFIGFPFGILEVIGHGLAFYFILIEIPVIVQKYRNAIR